MGTEVTKCKFSDLEFDEFKSRLKKETATMMRWFQNNSFETKKKSVGFELETWLIDSKYQPSPSNEKFLDSMKHPLVVPELSKYNCEINSDPLDLTGSCFRKMEEDLVSLWSKVQEVCNELDLKMLMIGSLPTVLDSHLDQASMSNLDRYRALNEQIMCLRYDQPFHVKIEGEEKLDIYHKNVMLEAAATSLQVHLRLDPSESAKYYNAGIIASAITVAAAANSPFVFGKRLWEETRISVFEQALLLPGFNTIDHNVVRRVTMGSGYLKQSMLECFLENETAFPILIPLIYDSGHEWLDHLRLHNGTIWRWNRPIVGLSESGRPHLRLEHRVQSAGPTPVDVIANIVFFIGLVDYIANLEPFPWEKLSFKDSHDNFYRGASQGLNAQVKWFDEKDYKIKDLILENLIEKVMESLQKLNIDQKDINYYIGDVLQSRVSSEQTGAKWQKSFVDKNGKNFNELVEGYWMNQKQGKPVHTWKI